MSDTLDSRDLEEQLKDPTTDDETKKAIKELKEDRRHKLNYIRQMFFQEIIKKELRIQTTSLNTIDKEEE